MSEVKLIDAQKRIDKLICNWSMASGHAFTEDNLNSLVDMIADYHFAALDQAQAESARLRAALENMFDAAEKCEGGKYIVFDRKLIDAARAALKGE